MPRLNILAVQAAFDDEQQREDEDEAYLDHNGDTWHFLRGTWRAIGDGLDHDNFFCDMALRLNGDFADRAQRQATLDWLAQRLNGTTDSMPDWARGRWSAVLAEKTVFHSNPERDLGLRISGDFGNPALRARALDGIARLLNGDVLPR